MEKISLSQVVGIDVLGNFCVDFIGLTFSDVYLALDIKCISYCGL